MLPFVATPLGRAAALAFEAAEQEVDVAPVMSTGAALAGYQGEVVRRRVRQAANNDGVVANALGDLRDGVRGPMVLHSTDPDTMARIRRWSRRAGYGLQFGTLAQVWARVAHELVTNGEVYVQRVEITPSDRAENGLRLQVWPIDSVDRSRGIEGHQLSDQGEYAGTYFRYGTPVESNRPLTLDRSTIFVPDRDLIAVRLIYEASSAWGYVLAAPALKAARISDSLALAEMKQAQLHANLTAIGLTETPTIYGPRIKPGIAQFTDAEGNTIDEVDPGTLVIGHGISKVQTLERESRVIDYNHAQARVAAGLRSTTERIGGSMGKASFSALRGATDQRRRVIANLRRDSGMIEALAELQDWYVESEALAGFTVDVATLSWLGDERETANDLQLVKSMEIERRLGWLDDDTAIRMRGRDPEIVKARLANDSGAPALRLIKGGAR